MSATVLVPLTKLLELIEEERRRHSCEALESPPPGHSLYDYGHAVGFMAGLIKVRDLILSRTEETEDDVSIDPDDPKLYRRGDQFD